MSRETLQPLDPERFGELRALYSAHELEGLIEVYLQTTPPAVEALRAAALAGDLPGVRDAAHRLRGGSLALGALELAEAAGTIERASATGQPVTLTPLDAAWEGLREALAAELPAG